MSNNDLIAALCQQVLDAKERISELEDLSVRRATEMRMVLDERDFLREQFKRRGGIINHAQD